MLAGSFDFLASPSSSCLHAQLRLTACGGWGTHVTTFEKLWISNLFRLRNKPKSDRLTVVSLSDFAI